MGDREISDSWSPSKTLKTLSFAKASYFANYKSHLPTSVTVSRYFNLSRRISRSVGKPLTRHLPPDIFPLKILTEIYPRKALSRSSGSVKGLGLEFQGYCLGIRIRLGHYRWTTLYHGCARSSASGRSHTRVLPPGTLCPTTSAPSLILPSSENC